MSPCFFAGGSPASTSASEAHGMPVFATADTSGLVTYCVVFLVMVGIWCALRRPFATRLVVAHALVRGGHLLLLVVLVASGLLIVVEGGAFGLGAGGAGARDGDAVASCAVRSPRPHPALWHEHPHPRRPSECRADGIEMRDHRP
jgi:hypothetical protein